MKKEALAQVVVALMTNEAGLYNHNGLRFLAMKGAHERLVQIQDHLLILGIVSWIRNLGGCPRLASTDSRLLLEVEDQLQYGIPADISKHIFGE